MAIQTTVQIKGILDGKEQTCLLTQDTGPEAIFKGRTARELFLLNVPNPGCRNIRDEDIQVNIDVQRKCSFGISGFTENNLQKAISKARELEEKSEDDLFVEGMPEPEVLFASAVKALLDGKKEFALALADMYAHIGEIVTGTANPDYAETFFEAATKTVGKINYSKPEDK